ncbi:LysR family transcriptional regulator [Nocardioides sp. LML1-1-1.1]|uniref:LysR family transcriptional regulator n=1 Tax=Nocardioides sp. LML1-1-1.1 TaxID=3135248 RepID=UPI00344A2FD5
MALEVRHLRAICAIDAAGSLSRAAVELGMSQPALTALLQRLERQVDTQLFVRDHAGVVPTPIGAQLVRRAKVALAEFDHLEVDLTGALRGTVLRAGISQTDFAAELVRRLDDALPDNEVVYTVANSTAELAQGLAHGHHDFSVVVISDDAEYQLPPEVSNRVLLATLPVFVALPATHPLAGEPEVALEQLARDTWISPAGAEDGSLAELRVATSKAGFDPQVRYHFANGRGRALVADGRAVELVLPTAAEQPGIVVKALAGDPIRYRVVAAWQRDRVEVALADRICAVASEVLATCARRSPAFVSWWERGRAADHRVRALDGVFGER